MGGGAPHSNARHETRMKIVRLETFPLSIAYSQVEHSSRVHRGGVSDVVVKLTADNGLIGWGESCSGADTASIVAALEAMKPFVVGQESWNSEIGRAHV